MRLSRGSKFYSDLCKYTVAIIPSRKRMMATSTFLSVSTEKRNVWVTWFRWIYKNNCTDFCLDICLLLDVKGMSSVHQRRACWTWPNRPSPSSFVWNRPAASSSQPRLYVALPLHQLWTNHWHFPGQVHSNVPSFLCIFPTVCRTLRPWVGLGHHHEMCEWRSRKPTHASECTEDQSATASTQICSLGDH